jgi:uncharacterized protein (DUF302 family)
MSGQGVVTRASKLSVAQTLDRLQALLQARGLTSFARIDHAGGAAQVGLAMPPCELLVFGSPRGGTPIMVAAPTAALDLPFKALAWQDAQGAVWLSYNAPAYLAARFGLSDAQVETLAPLVALLEQALGSDP